MKILASAVQPQNYLQPTVELMKVMARACGHDRLSGFSPKDLTTYQKQMSQLTGVRFAGVGE